MQKTSIRRIYTVKTRCCKRRRKSELVCPSNSCPWSDCHDVVHFPFLGALVVVTVGDEHLVQDVRPVQAFPRGYVCKPM